MSLDVYLIKSVPTKIFRANITHNLVTMAESAGIYRALWRPEDLEITEAGQLIHILEIGLSTLKADPERFKQLNPSNGWGNYECLVEFVEEYLKACKKDPDAVIEVSR